MYRRIIVRMPNWVGDFVMATPVIEDIKENYPDAYLTVLCSDHLGDLLQGNPHVDEVILFSRKRRFFPRDSEGESLLKRIKRGRFDLGVVLPPTFSAAWLFFAGGVKKRIGYLGGYAASGRRLLLNCGLKMPKDVAKQHLVITYKMLLQKELGIALSETKPRLYIPALQRDPYKIIFGINPGAAYGSAKCWLIERFQEVAKRLTMEVPDSEVWIFGDKKSDLWEGIPGVRDLSGKTTLFEFVARLAACDVLLTNDSGPMHLGAALKTPLVALFGSTNDVATGPYQWGQVIHKRVSCSPCYKRVCPIDFRCMTQITVEEVVRACKEALLIPLQARRAEPLKEKEIMPVPLPEPFFIAKGLPRKAGCIILAGGRGSRLGVQGPKGCIEVRGKTLYEHLLDKAKGKGPVAIITSAATHLETEILLKKKGLDVDLCQIRTLPTLPDGLAYEEFPEGNGAIFRAFRASPFWEEWRDIEMIHVLPIDNIFATPFDPMILRGEEELVVEAVQRIDSKEKMGLLVLKEGALHVWEYFDHPPDTSAFTCAYDGIFSMSRTLFERASETPLPQHPITRLSRTHFEQLVFDAFPLAKSYRILLKPREGHFQPIKTAADLAGLQ